MIKDWKCDTCLDEKWLEACILLACRCSEKFGSCEDRLPCPECREKEYDFELDKRKTPKDCGILCIQKV